MPTSVRVDHIASNFLSNEFFIGPSTMISWVSVGRTLGVTVGYPFIGRLSDIFGRRWFFIAGNGVAIIDIIIAASAMSVVQLIVGAVIYSIREATQFSFPFESSSKISTEQSSHPSCLGLVHPLLHLDL
jgi:MFS family permease